MDNKSTPYLSVVVTSRNDNHGGDMLKRMTIFVNCLIHQCNKYKVFCELVMVDWNSPDPTCLLDQVLPKPKETDYLKIKYVVVPPVIHDRLNYSTKLGLYQMIAKNVGIRRASAEFVLCTNVDLLFSDEIFEYLAAKKMQSGKFYRAVRCDIPNSIDETLTVTEQLKFCRNNILKTLGKDRRFPIIKNDDSFLFKHKILNPLLYPASWLKRVLARKMTPIHRLDFDACGDFTLMSKSDWLKISGYVELEMYSIHIDSMGLFSAAAMGIEQVLLPKKACAFHIAHTGGWEFASPIEKLHFYSEKPSLEWWAVWQAGKEIFLNRKNFDINDENWGLVKEELKEI